MAQIIPHEAPFRLTLHHVTPAIRRRLRERPLIRSTLVYKRKKGGVTVELFCPNNCKRRDPPPPEYPPILFDYILDDWIDYDMASIDFPDAGHIAMGFESRRYLVFDMEWEIRYHFLHILNMCQLRDIDGPTLVEAVRARDAAMLRKTGLSALATPLLRELIFLAARGGWEMEMYSRANRSGRASRPATTTPFGAAIPPADPKAPPPPPPQEDMLRVLARAGPPSNHLFTTMLRVWIYQTSHNSAHHFFPGDIEAALIRGGWRRPEHNGMMALARCGDGADALAGDKELIVTLEGLGQLASQNRKMQCLQAIASRGSPELMRWTLERMPLSRITRRQACSILPTAARGPYLIVAGAGIVNSIAYTNPLHRTSRVPMVTMLLDELGLDPNLVDYRQPPAAAGGHRSLLALHMAVQYGEARVVQLLLMRGAGMVRDVDGRTPLDMARDLEDARKLRLLEEWFDAKGLPHDHEDEPNFVEDDRDEVLQPPRPPSPENWRTSERYRGKWFLFRMFWRQLMKNVPRYQGGRV